jgi:hypothetical protein
LSEGKFDRITGAQPGGEFEMKKLIIIGAILVLASMACATYESFFTNTDSADGSGNLQQPTSILVLQPTATTRIATPAPTSTPIIPPATRDTSAEPTEETIEPTADQGAPSTNNFFTCTGPCIYDGSNDQGSFSERTEIIYFQFEYENFPVGASYTRWWTRNGVEWARYQCAWPGPESGLEQITLTEPNGLASGTWQVTITIDGVIVLQETLVVQGTWNYWDPAGFFSACYGKR